MSKLVSILISLFFTVLEFVLGGLLITVLWNVLATGLFNQEHVSYFIGLAGSSVALVFIESVRYVDSKIPVIKD